jgi:hypothetical protein
MAQNTSDQSRTDSDPWAIANDPTLDARTKRQRLHDLEYLVRQVQVATEEGMEGKSSLPSLHDVLAALAEVEPDEEPAHTPTKM